MSQENVEAFERAIEAGGRFDVAALLEELDPHVEWHPALPASLGGQTTVYWGHEGARKLISDFEEVFAESQMEFSEIRDLGDRIVAFGRIRNRGKGSGAAVESHLAYVVEFKNGKATRIRAYLDPKEALEAAGLSE
jgi:ketosteroid isomerase-like protein